MGVELGSAGTSLAELSSPHRYAYPPDYDERLARERVAKETDWERQKKRIEGGQWPGLPGSGGYLGMGPA